MKSTIYYSHAPLGDSIGHWRMPCRRRSDDRISERHCTSANKMAEFMEMLK